MFDLVSGTAYRPFRDRHPGATAISIASHVVVLGIATVGTLFFVKEQFPEVPTLMAFVADVPAPAPPPPPPPPPPLPSETRPPREAAPPKPVATTGPIFTAPAEIPTGIEPESRIDLGGEGGVVGGVEGGIPGGVVGGIPGGIVSEVAPPPPPKKPIRIGGNIQQPALINRVAPVYPSIAVSAKIIGTVILEATVNEAGEVTSVVVVRSIPLLDRSAVDAIKQWRYAPLLMNGAPSPFILTVTFSLK